MTPKQKRAQVVRKYEEILGRNRYSQKKRGYAFKKYTDGRYYSDCSSSIALAYKEAGYPVRDNAGSACPNTVGMYLARTLTDVPVRMENGLILNPEVLREGDMLLFAGTDSSRAYADCVGHVEMVGRIEGSRITLYGHGSGTPRATEMNAYLKSRRAKKTDTKIGTRRLLKVRRLIPDESSGGSDSSAGNAPTSSGSSAPNASGANGSGASNASGSNAPNASGANGSGATNASGSNAPNASGAPTSSGSGTPNAPFNSSSPTAPNSPSASAAPGCAPAFPEEGWVLVTGGSVNLRTGPGTAFPSVRIARRGESYPLAPLGSWLPADTGSRILWISRSWARLSDGRVQVTGGSVNLRTGPGTSHPVARIARRGESYPPAPLDRWLPVNADGRILWISRSWARMEDEP